MSLTSASASLYTCAYRTENQSKMSWPCFAATSAAAGHAAPAGLVAGPAAGAVVAAAAAGAVVGAAAAGFGASVGFAGAAVGLAAPPHAARIGTPTTASPTFRKLRRPETRVTCS